jgi:hypothetical protein
LFAADRNAFGYWRRGTASPVGILTSLPSAATLLPLHPVLHGEKVGMRGGGKHERR